MECKQSPFCRTRPRIFASTLIVCVLLFLVGCPKKPGQFDSLFGAGLIPVSSDNPFVGSNLYLAREMERSAYLLNFFRSKGPPQAIELLGVAEESPELKLFYAGRREMYVAQASDDKKLKIREWIVRGPYAVGREYYKEVSKLPPESSAVFEIYGTKEYFGREATPARTLELKPVFVPTPIPTPRPIIKRRPTISPADSIPTPSPAPSPMNLDQRAILESQQKQNAPKLPLVTVVSPVPHEPTIARVPHSEETPTGSSKSDTTPASPHNSPAPNQAPTLGDTHTAPPAAKESAPEHPSEHGKHEGNEKAQH